jgi:hypothetical protein
MNIHRNGIVQAYGGLFFGVLRLARLSLEKVTVVIGDCKAREAPRIYQRTRQWKHAEKRTWAEDTRGRLLADWDEASEKAKAKGVQNRLKYVIGQVKGYQRPDNYSGIRQHIQLYHTLDDTDL